MADNLDEVPPGKLTSESRVGRPPKYPWELWMNGEIHEIECKSATDLAGKRTLLYTQARYHNMKCVTRKKDGNKLVFQFMPNVFKS